MKSESCRRDEIGKIPLILKRFSLFLSLRQTLKKIREYGLWRYIVISDNRTCRDCMSHQGQIYQTEDETDPTELMDEFPYGEVESPTMFLPHTHPNCRCKIIRSYSGEKHK